MDLLIVGNETDPFAQAIQSDFAAQGKTTRILGVLEAAQLFTLNISSGQIQITPDVPMILRPPTSPPDDADNAFQHAEALSTLWATAAACQSPVLNRPTPKDMFGAVSFSTVLTQHRARSPIDTQEKLTSQLPNQLVSTEYPQAWFTQDLDSYDVAAAPAKPKGNGPYRTRQTYREGSYEKVVVLKDNAWRSTQVKLPALELEGDSIQILRNLDLDFGVITWNIAADLQAATIARIDPFPSLEQVSLVWTDLKDSLYQEMFG